MDETDGCQPQSQSMEFINALKEAQTVGISTSEFKEIWMTELKLKLMVEERQKKNGEKETGDTTEVRTRRPTPVSKGNRVGTIFNETNLPSISEPQKLTNGYGEPVQQNLGNGSAYGDGNERVSEEMNFPPQYENHRQHILVSTENLTRTVLCETNIPSFSYPFSDHMLTNEGVWSEQQNLGTHLPDGGECEQRLSEIFIPPDYITHGEYEKVLMNSLKSLSENGTEESDTLLKEIPTLEENEDTTYIKTLDAEEEEEKDEVLTPEEKSELLDTIRKLTEEQKNLKDKINEHDERLNTLRKKPSIQRRLTAKTKRNASCIMEVNLKEEARIYAQIEQLYANFSRINFPFHKTTTPYWMNRPSMSEDNIYSDPTTNTVTLLIRENRELREKIFVLETASKENVTENAAIESLKSQQMFENDETALKTTCSPLSSVNSDIQHIESTFEWEILYYSERLEMEKAGKKQCTVSDTFEIGQNGYMGQLEIYLNGNGAGCNKGLSLFLRIIKGKFDARLKWPVEFSLKFILVNQDDRRSESLIYGKDDKLFKYQRPLGDGDNECDSWGLIEFVPHAMIAMRKYIKNDSIKIQVKVRKKFV